MQTSWADRLVAIAAVVGVLGALGGVWLNSNNKAVEQASRIYTLEQRMESLNGVGRDITELKTDMRQVKQNGERVADALSDLAVSQNRLAVAIGKLQERTGKE